MSQSKIGSFIESLTNTLSGTGIAFLASLYIFPAYGFNPSVGDNIEIVCFFTIVGVARNYILRRFFNKI